jgi:hypothetical protein
LIYLGLSIRNPFMSVQFRNYWCRWWRIPRTAHKNIELEFLRTENLVHVNLDINPWTDHGGFSLMMGVLHHEFQITFYDGRHWDRDSGQWMPRDDH